LIAPLVGCISLIYSAIAMEAVDEEVMAAAGQGPTVGRALQHFPQRVIKSEIFL